MIDISEGLTGLLHKQSSEHRNDVLKWLTPIDYASQQHDYFRSRQPGTGQWLLNSDQYHRWLKNSAEILFCQGIPGAEKTILTSMVIDQLTTKFHDDLDTGIAYIYFNYHQRDERAENLLLSLLKQLTQKKSFLPPCVNALYEQRRDKGIPPSLETISLALQTVARAYSRTFIVVDALDECPDSNDCRVWQRFSISVINQQ